MNPIVAKLAACCGSVLVWSLPSVAWACPVCFSAQNEDNRVAFVMMTAFLTLLPLGMLGLGLGFAWRRMRLADERIARPEPATLPAVPVSRSDA